MKNIFTITGFLICMQLGAQVDVFNKKNIDLKDSSGWKLGGFSAVNFNQVQLTNWAAGGQSSYSLSGVLNTFADYHYGRTSWENSLDLGYGLLKNQDERVKKNEDKIELNSKYGKKMVDHLYATMLLNFRTQFSDGYNYPNDSVITSRFMAPGYLTIAPGVDWKPNNNFSFFVSPITAKFTWVLDQSLADSGAFGVDPATFDTSGNRLTAGRRFRSEFGASILIQYKKDFNENVSLQTKLLLFNNYTDPIKKNRGNIDVNFDALLNMKLGKYIAASLFVNIIYDHDIDLPTYEDVEGVRTEVGKGPKTQFKETFGLGFSYKFGKER